MYRGIKNIVFDLGGVLIDLEPERTLKAFAELKKYSQTKNTKSLAAKEEKGKSPISINDLIGGGESEWMQKYQIGKISTEELALRAGFTHQRCWFHALRLLKGFTHQSAVSRASHLFQGFTHQSAGFMPCGC